MEEKPASTEAGASLLTTDQAARLLGLSPNTLKKARVYGGSGNCPYIKLGRAVRYSSNDLARYVRENATHSTSERWETYAGPSPSASDAHRPSVASLDR